MDLKKWAELQESLLKSQLKVIREFLHETGKPVQKQRNQGRSQMDVVYDILHAANQPLHISEIIARAQNDLGVQLDRESIVSAVTKKVKSGRMFRRVAPNTYTTLDGEGTIIKP